MSEVKHTPGPWSIHRDSEGDVDFVIHALGHATGYNEDDEPYTEVCRVPVEKYGYGAACDSEANAAFIVEACNNRDALRAQLTAALKERDALRGKFEEGAGDGSDKSQDVAWLRGGFLSRGAEIEKLEASLTAAQVEIGGYRHALSQISAQDYHQDGECKGDSEYCVGHVAHRALVKTPNASAGERVIEALKLAQRDLNTWTLAHEKVSEALAALKEVQ